MRYGLSEIGYSPKPISQFDNVTPESKLRQHDFSAALRLSTPRKEALLIAKREEEVKLIMETPTRINEIDDKASKLSAAAIQMY